MPTIHSLDRIADIRACADTLVVLPAFASPRRAKLLRYLIERTLAGESDQISEYGIGLDVFDKPPEFDPRIESVVRTEVGRLRQKLKEYYLAEGRADQVVIELPLRSYIPIFTFPEATPAPIAQESPSFAEPVASVEARNNGLPVWIAVSALVAVVLGLVVWKFQEAVAIPDINSLVVLPFQSLSAERGDDYLADGVTEELTNAVAQWKDVRVVARTSAAQFKGRGTDIREIGRKLNVDAVLEGSVAKQGDHIRVTAQLNRTSDGYHLWSKAYDSRSVDLMTVQQEIAQSIAATVRKLGGRPPRTLPSVPTTNSQALDLYLQGSYQRSRMTPDSLRKSITLFEEATRKDPSYARAFFALADAESELVGMTSDPALAGSERVRASLRKVLELDPNSPDAHGALAKIAYDLDWDWPHSEREFQLALDQGARSGTRAAYGWALTTRGRFPEAQIQCQAAEGLDPLGVGPRTCQFWIYYFQHKYPEAKRVLTALLDLNHESLYAHALLGLIAAIQHDCGESQAQFGTIAATYTLPVTKIGLAYASACAGDESRARKYLTEAEAMKGFGYTSPYQLALGYAFLNDKQEALRYLRKSAVDREGQIHYLKYDPVFDRIRSDPQFRELEKTVGLE